MKKIVLAVGLILLSILTVVRGLDPAPVRELRSVYFDYLQILKPREYQQLPVRVIDVDEASLAKVGQWPWPREKLAELTTRLTEYGAAVVAFDVLFAEPDRMSPSLLVGRLAEMNVPVSDVGLDSLAQLNTDLMFARSMSSVPVVVGIAQANGGQSTPPRAKAGFVEIGDQPGLSAPVMSSPSTIVPVLRQAAAGIGAVSVDPKSEGGIVRTVPLIWNTGAGLYPSFSVEILRLALGAGSIVLQGASDNPGYMETMSIGEFVVPTQPDGQIYVRYRHPNPELYVPAWKVLEPGINPDIAPYIQGNVVLIGTSAAGLVDIRTTSLHEDAPGVSILAQIIEQILSGQYLSRNAFVENAEIVAFVILGAIVLAVMTWFGPMASITAGMFSALIVVAGSWVAFTSYGILFDATFPIVGGFLAFSGLAAYQFIVADRDKRLIRRSFSHYVAPSILDQIERSGHHIALGGINREVTIMFCDIRSFTPLSESMSATDLVALLNRLFTALGAEILDRQGTIDKFIGDAIMAFWNAPFEAENHRELAATAALAMRKALAGFNADKDHRPIATAIGLSSGIACVGNIGSRDRFNYSVIGDTVNVAARIEAACRHVEYDILVTETTAAGLAGMALLEAGRLDLKGKSDVTHAFILVGDETLAADPRFVGLRNLHETAIAQIAQQGAVDDALLVECRALGQSIEPGLAAFYDRLPARAKDFASNSGHTPSGSPAPEWLQQAKVREG